MTEERGLKRHGPLWRSLFDPLYISPWLFIDPLIVGIVFATILGILIGWQGVALGLIFGLLLGGLYGARVLLVRWVTRKRDQGE